MSSFSNALKNFSELDPDTAIERLHDLFSEISEMRTEKVIAAKHTLDAYQDVVDVELNKQQQKLLEALTKALCRQAQIILADTGMDSEWGKFEGTFTMEELEDGE